MAKDPELNKAVTRALIRMEKGADGYKDKAPPKLIEAIQKAPLVDEESLGEILPVSPTRLSLREIEVWLLVSHGATNEQVGKHLGISPETVKSIRMRARKKLGAINSAHMIRRIFEEGYIE